MLTTLPRANGYISWKTTLARIAGLGLLVLMTVQFVGCYLFLTFPYLDPDRFAHGYERLPFQTRLLLAPLFRWAEKSAFMAHYTSHLATNSYFFPQGIQPAEVLEFFVNIPCVLIAGWVAVRIYRASSRRHLLGWLVYPLFLVLCAVSYILHTVQNFRFLYDMPSLAFFSLGLYLIYFRRSTLLLVGLFALATLNRETTLLLIPFYLLSEVARRQEGEGWLALPLWFRTAKWRRVIRPHALATAALMLAYWAVWHVFIFHLFRHNSSEYYPRISFNLYCFRRLRYYPQLFSACGYLLPFLFLFRRHVRDAQLRLWMWMIPVWYVLMSAWGILVETRVFGELLPLIACVATLIAEEALAARVQAGSASGAPDEEDGERIHLIRAA